MISFKKIFNKEKNIIIGALHFPALLGYPEFPGIETALDNALKDLESFVSGGVDAIIFENNYDLPHKINIDPEVVACMTYLGSELKKASHIPMGVSVLWNDYKAALSIAKILNLKFVRVPVFVDKVKTDYGIVAGNYNDVINYRKSIGAENVALFTDIHVKHAELLSTHTLEESAKLAIENGSDALIITGRWTGDEPNLDQLKNLRNTIGDFPILVGSGLDKSNVKELFNYANGAIVSTSLKENGGDKHSVNVRQYDRRISIKKVSELLEVIKNK